MPSIFLCPKISKPRSQTRRSLKKRNLKSSSTFHLSKRLKMNLDTTFRTYQAHCSCQKLKLKKISIRQPHRCRMKGGYRSGIHTFSRCCPGTFSTLIHTQRQLKHSQGIKLQLPGYLVIEAFWIGYRIIKYIRLC
jgi:hypothetical protein